MERSIITAERSYWDNAYSRGSRIAAESNQPHWLQTLLTEADVGLSGRVLELGCGKGYDTGYLVRAGCQVVALDFSRTGLQHAATALPMARFVQAALHDPLPFQPACFDAVVAGLSLHYFRWNDTLAILQEIRRVLGPGRLLVFRVNSVDDVAHGYGQGEQIEPRLFVRAGHYKRFFTEADCYDLFTDGWHLALLRPFIERRYGEDQLKPTWAGIARTL